MNSTSIKREGWLYGLAFLIAIALRFIALGASTLTDSEATLALQALGIARGESPLLAPQPAYILLTSALFAIIESTDFLARFLPALTGSLMVFAPYFFREKIRPHPALIIAFLFAFDPGLVALSRQANGTILAATFLLFAWAMWNHKRLILAGIFAALALLSGPSLWAGILTLAITHIFLRGTKPSASNNQTPIADSEITNQQSKIVNRQSAIFNPASQFSNPQLLISFFATFLLGGALFFLAPNGLSAAFSFLPAYLGGWVAPTVTTPGRILFTFFTYELLGVFLASLAIFRAVRTNGKRAKRLMVWLGIALLLAVFYRQPGELVWAVIPLLTLSALELSRAFEIHREERVEVGIVVIALSILLVYTWFNISSIALDPYNPLPTTLPLIGVVQNARALVLTGSLLIVLVCIALVALGWSARIARLGATICFSAFLAVYALAAAWGASGLRNPNGFELWTADPRIAQADLLLASVNDLSEFSLGHPDSQPVTAVGILSPALEWTLRDHSVEMASVLDPQQAPAIVVTPLMNDLGLPSAYRGQDFTWRRQPPWANLQTQDWLKWFVFRDLPMENETIILWARDDLFPDARGGAQP
ncbi:MAG: hypothetical protein DCC56_05205 [Anaerolineae bacterium]|nr:MAG: hypothetical protein DCC56_05205 [Anaerolineae bacterium]WKZ43748.1 MAG: hypothetical protein QY302_16765 [Anaerolineales bacterium]